MSDSPKLQAGPVPIRVPLLDLRHQHTPLKAELRAAFDAFFETPRFILGEAVEEFEQSFAELLGVPHAIGVSSGSDALLCSLLALGVGPGDEVITTPFTFVATAEAIVRAGATPCFVDIDPISFNLDPKQIEANVGERTRAIIPVHLFGEPADLDSILDVAKRHGLAVVEDAAQALGAEYRDQAVGTLGAFGCFSFFPSKPLGAWGDGGMIVTTDAELARHCRETRSHGRNSAGHFAHRGGNFRLDALQASLLSVKLQYLPDWLIERRSLAARYQERLSALSGIELPRSSPLSQPAYAQYTIRVASERDRLAEFLRARGIETAVYYRTPLHLEPTFAELGRERGRFPEAERAAAEVLSLPLYVGLDTERQSFVIESIEEFFLG